MVAKILGCLLLVVAMVGGGTVMSADKPKSSEPPKLQDTAPDFALKNLQGRTVKLSKLRKDGPVVVLMLRGWPGYQCPICSRQVTQFLNKADEFAEHNATVVLVYPGPADKLAGRADEFISGKTLPKNFELVIDPDYTMTNQYNLRWDAPRETAYPSTFVVDRAGKIQFTKVSKTHAGRSRAPEVLAALQKL
ncbi:peroxiredoxin family protein [Thalassoroseus pseudoceratinae]|uniref:peroxiredoxin family protein n=1 Tax=Thalassoroseus pseudoceratinae TaxID=2713176 RepID=UPI001422EF1C|nr:peroxiredoxin family protein [Thalassoroseus pseudoceratinae]